MSMHDYFTLLVALGLSQVACDGEGDGGEDADVAAEDADESDGATSDADSTAESDIDEPPSSPWDELDWHPLNEAGDPSGDCVSADAECAGDIIQLSYALEDEVLYLDLRFAGPFGAIENGSYELFIFPPAVVATGHAIRNVGGTMTFWDASCAGSYKHSGCHWTLTRSLDSFQEEWVGDERYICQIALATWDWEGLPEILLGVAVAPFLIERSAEFTDRYPDDLWITSTAIEGLQTVTLR